MNRKLALTSVLLLIGLLHASLTVLESTENSILVEFVLDDYQLVEEQGFVHIDAPGADYPVVVGSPLLPRWEAKVGIPRGGDATLQILNTTTSEVKLANRLLPVPKVVMGNDISEYQYIAEPEQYSGLDAGLLRALDKGSYRGYGFLPFEITPFRYDGGTELIVTQRALIRIQLQGDVGYRSEPVYDETAELMLSHLINSNQARFWRESTRSEVNSAPFGNSDFWLRIETSQEGMHKITPDQLNSLPLADIDPRSFRLFSTGGELLPFTVVTPGPEFRELPIRVVGEADGSFDTGDYIVFYGTNRDGIAKNQSLQTNSTYFNPYSGNTVYWLTFAGQFAGEPLRMQTAPVLTAWDVETSTTSAQERLETESQRRETIGFDWFMTRLFGNSTAEYQFEINLAQIDTSVPQTLSFMIRQEDVDNSSLWHNINVTVNNTPVLADTTGSLTFRWRGTGEYIFYKEVSSFVPGTNTIRIKVIRSSTDNLFLNWITVDYRRPIGNPGSQSVARQLELNYGVPVRYNLSASINTLAYRVSSFSDIEVIPLQDAGSHFVASGQAGTNYYFSTDAQLFSPVSFALAEPEDLTANPSQADNIIISPDEFLVQAQALADMYFSDFGKRSRVVRQTDIFNQFNGGHPDPAAIRQYLRYAYQFYPEPAISSVTLLGLGTIDWRNFSGQANPKNKIMVYQRSLTASDDYYVMLTQSAYPELAIGRYPVTNANELNNMMSNLQNYVRNPQGGWWRNSMVFLGDDLFNGSSNSYENIHTRQTQEAADVVHPSILVDKIFAWEYEYDEFQNKPGARDDMVSAINDGRLVWYYIGHGSYDKLGAEDYFNGASDMGRFNNPRKLPFFMAASCKVSHFDYWTFESLGQKTVLLDNRGAIASYSATRISAPYNNAPMMQFVLQNLANGRNPVGYSIMRAKTQYTQSNENDATYVLLGDPLLKIVPPERDSLITVSGSASPEGDLTFQARELVQLDGGFSPSNASGIGEIRVFNTEPEYNLDWQTHVSHRGSQLFNGSVSVTGGSYNGRFIVPDDVITGDTGLLVSYFWDDAGKRDYTNFLHPLSLSDEAIAMENTDDPEIEIMLGSMDFRPGDTVGENPVLYARISDSNGINVTGSSGHGILMILDNALQPVPVTSHFSYDLDSHTQGTLTYQLSGLAEGPHTLQIIAFDNFNLPSVASASFNVKKSGEIAIERFLIYPNPMKQDTSFTFMLSRDCDLSVGIYTISGKKVQTIETAGRQGFNVIKWNGRDNRGDRLANNTYFVKIRAVADGDAAEKTEKLVIYN